MAISSWRYPTTVKFGVGAVSLATELLKQAQVQRPLVVTDKNLMGLDVFKNFCMMLERSGLQVKVYGEASGNPVESHVTEGVAVYRSHQADGIVIMGGGCALDVGKAIGLMVNHPGKLFQYEDDNPTALPMKYAFPYVIAIPTTAGTGSEVGGSSVISDNSTHAKVIIWGPKMVPNCVIADPELTLELPPNVTAATGIDALTHNIEAFLAKNFHPMGDGIALEGIRLVHQSLEKAVFNPSDLEARGNMLLASMMGAVAFQKGLGVTHSCAHSLSTCYNLHHGLANGMMLIPCMLFNFKAVPERFARMGRMIGLDGTERDVGLGFIKWLQKLRLKIGIPATLRDLNVTLTDRLLDVAVGDACHANNPVPVTREDFKNLFESAITGKEI